MNRLFFLAIILAALGFAACQEKVESPSIRGSVYEGGNKTIFLLDLTRKGAKPDSTSLSLNGDFEFFVDVTEPKDFLLYFDQENYIRLLLLPDEYARITADAENLLGTYRVEGSSQSEYLRQVMTTNMLDNIKIDSLNMIYRTNESNPKLLQIMDQLQSEAVQIFSKQRQSLEKVIKSNQSPLVSYVALSLRLGSQELFSATKDIELFKMVDTAVQRLYAETTIGITLHKFVESNAVRVNQRLTADQRMTIGNIAPEIALPGPTGDTVFLSSFRGKYVLIDFWASWCKPCRLENPNLVKNFYAYRWKNFAILQVSLDKDKNEWTKAIRTDNLGWNHVSDLKMWDSRAAKEYNVSGIPSNFLVDPEGRIIAIDLRGEGLANKLRELFPYAPVRKKVEVDSTAI